jgi:hypothetical protein
MTPYDEARACPAGRRLLGLLEDRPPFEGGSGYLTLEEEGQHPTPVLRAFLRVRGRAWTVGLRLSPWLKGLRPDDFEKLLLLCLGQITHEEGPDAGEADLPGRPRSRA